MKIRITRIAPVLLAASLLVLPGTAAASTGSASTVHLDGTRTTLATNPATTGVLVSHGILPLPVGPSTVAPRFGDHGLSLRYGFPITGGRVNATTLAGYINHSGGLRFVNLANGHTLTLTKFRIRISAHPGLTAAVNGDPSVRVRILNLDLSHAMVDKNPPTVKVSNVKATLSDEGAAALNGVFGTSFEEGLPIGIATVATKLKRDKRRGRHRG